MTWTGAVISFVAALAWTAALALSPGPFDSGAVLLLGVGILGLATVAVAGLVLTGARWARRSALAALVGMLAVAVVRPIDALWFVGLLAASGALVALYVPGITSRIRRLPAAAGPPDRAVLLPLLLVGFPAVLGLVSIDSTTPAGLAVGLGAPVAAFWYARVLPGGLLAMRFAWPALALILAPLQPIAPAITSLVLGLGVAALAADSSVKVAFHPPRETGTAYGIPPELTPREILDTAHLDERGRPK